MAERTRSREPVTQAKLRFVIDATRSRSKTWKLVQKIQGQMFAATARYGNLLARVIYFRGRSEVAAVVDHWVDTSNVKRLIAGMAMVDCRIGSTQYLRVARENWDLLLVSLFDAHIANRQGSPSPLRNAAKIMMATQDKQSLLAV